MPLTDLVRLAWRQHRGAVAAVGALVGALCGWMVWNLQRIGAPGAADASAGPAGTGLAQVGLVSGYAALVAVFVAAPAAARECERRTAASGWGRPGSSTRWLAGTVVVLGTATALFALALGGLSDDVLGRIEVVRPGSVALARPFLFEAFAPLQAAYAVFGCALGLACGVALRRRGPAMAVTLVVFVSVRVGVGLVRFDYGVRAVLASRLIESGLYLGLAAAAGAVAWSVVRRNGFRGERPLVRSASAAHAGKPEAERGAGDSG